MLPWDTEAEGEASAVPAADLSLAAADWPPSYVFFSFSLDVWLQRTQVTPSESIDYSGDSLHDIL